MAVQALFPAECYFDKHIFFTFDLDTYVTEVGRVKILINICIYAIIIVYTSYAW